MKWRRQGALCCCFLGLNCFRVIISPPAVSPLFLLSSSFRRKLSCLKSYFSRGATHIKCFHFIAVAAKSNFEPSNPAKICKGFALYKRVPAYYTEARAFPWDISSKPCRGYITNMNPVGRRRRLFPPRLRAKMRLVWRKTHSHFLNIARALSGAINLEREAPFCKRY